MLSSEVKRPSMVAQSEGRAFGGARCATRMAAGWMESGRRETAAEGGRESESGEGSDGAYLPAPRTMHIETCKESLEQRGRETRLREQHHAMEKGRSHPRVGVCRDGGEEQRASGGAAAAQRSDDGLVQKTGERGEGEGGRGDGW